MSFRIDGIDKVTGKKVYGRDYFPSDFGWISEYYTVIIIRSTVADRKVLGIKGEIIPSEIKPDLIVNGNVLKADNIKMVISSKMNKYGSFWLVPIGDFPDYIGQPVAFAYFSSPDKSRLFYKWLSINPQIIEYSVEKRNIGEQDIRNVIDPLLSSVQKDPSLYFGSTHYVRLEQDGGEEDIFCFAKPDIDVGGKLIRDHNPYILNPSSGLSEVALKRNLRSREILNTIQQMSNLNDWKVVDRTYYTQNSDAAFMEPESGLAWYIPLSKNLKIVYGTQSTWKDMENIKAMTTATKFEQPLFDYQPCFPGGGFGARDESSFPMLICLASFYVDKPVKLAFNRYEQFIAGIKSHAAVVKNSIAYDKRTGKIESFLSSAFFDGGGELNLSMAVIGLAALQSTGIYYIPRAGVSTYCIKTVGSPAGSQRGFGIPQMTFAIESMVDEIAGDLKVDPIDYRVNQAIKNGQKDITGSIINHHIANLDILSIARQHPLWLKRDHVKQQKDNGSISYGVGFAAVMESYGTNRDAVLLEIELTPQGEIVLYSSAVDMGQGSATALSIATQTKLGLSASKVFMAEASRFDALELTTSNKTPKITNAMSASITAFFHLHAVDEACSVLYKHCFLVSASKLWNTDPSDAVLENDKLTKKGFKPISVIELIKYAHENGLITSVMVHTYFQVSFASAKFEIDEYQEKRYIDALGVRKGSNQPIKVVPRSEVVYPKESANSYQRSLYASAGQIVAVEINRKSGKINIKDVVTILDAGDVHHEALLKGQVEGGFAMGLSHALLENIPAPPEGVSGNWNFNNYFISRNYDLIPINHEIVILPFTKDNILDDGPIVKKKGIAEAMVSITAPAIHNAIAHATGLRINSLPFSSEKLLPHL